MKNQIKIAFRNLNKSAFTLKQQTQLVDFCLGWIAGIGNCVAYGFVSILESSNIKILLKA